MKRKLLFSIVFLWIAGMSLVSQKADAQTDPQFSQYLTSPLWLNPGLTGAIDGDFRISANYRRQGMAVKHPYATTALSFDTYSNKNIALGAAVLNQSAGDAGYNYLNAVASAAYHLSLDEKQYQVISIGLQAGILNKRIDQGKLNLRSGWDPNSSIVNPGSNPMSFDKTSTLQFDANVGAVYYNTNPNLKVNPFGGVSIYHLSRPKSTLLKGNNERLAMRATVFGGAKIALNNKMNLIPRVAYFNQGDLKEWSAGIYAAMLLSDQAKIQFGVSYFSNDALVPFVGIHFNDFALGLSYDVNTSGLKAASKTNNGFELSFSFIAHKKNKSQQSYPIW